MNKPMTSLMVLVAMSVVLNLSCRKDEQHEPSGREREAAQPVVPESVLDASIRSDVEKLKSAIGRLRARDASIQEKNAARAECEAIAERLGSRGGDVVPALTDLLGEEDVHLRTYAVKALGKTRAESAVPALEKAIQEGETGIRISAISAIRDFAIGKRPVLPKGSAARVLLGLTKDKDPLIRKEAVWCLLGFYDYPVVQRLEELTRDEDPGVQQAAGDVLKKVVRIREELKKKGAWKGENPLAREAPGVGSTERGFSRSIG